MSISLRTFGFTHYDIEIRRLSRQGEPSREEAPARRKTDPTAEPYRSIIDGVLDTLGSSGSDLER